MLHPQSQSTALEGRRSLHEYCPSRVRRTLGVFVYATRNSNLVSPLELLLVSSPHQLSNDCTIDPQESSSPS